jgi:DNA topoisomerase-3
LVGKLPKTKKVFDNSKVTDHHAIIPTGVNPTALNETEKKVFDLVARRFIANFYPECKISTTTVLGEVKEIEFKVNGKQILDPGWRVVFAKAAVDDKEGEEEEERTLPLFVRGESGPHEPTLAEKWTSPPKPFTEATLLRAMETAGKLVDNDELRDALKENGIGRPSTRAAIIETLFKRDYVRKEKKNLIATITGVELIQVIQEDLLKSAELTGMWEKKLRQVERGQYAAKDFLDELKAMVTEIVFNVKSDNRRPTSPIAPLQVERGTKKSVNTAKLSPTVKPSPEGSVCPLCGKGFLLKGSKAYGCSEWKAGCTYRIPL